MRTSTFPRPVLALLTALGILSTVAACSAGDDEVRRPDASGTPSASASASATAEAGAADFSAPPADIEKVTAECADGVVTITQSNQDVTVGDCTKVVVDASNSVIHLGAVEQLVVNGSINDIDATTVGALAVAGNGNRVTSDSDPKPDDSGEDNVFVTR